jgi:hypothetical protein
MKFRIIITILILAGVALGVLGIYEFQHRPTTETLSQALTAQITLQSEVKTLQLHDSVDYTNAIRYKNQNALLNSQKATLCQLIAAHKLSSTACN